MSRRGRRIVRTAVAVVLVLLVGELLARVFAPRPDAEPGIFVADPDTGWRTRPDLEAGKGGPINSQGFRDVERTIEKPPGKRRVLVLGDSFAVSSVAMADGFVGRLDSMLGDDVEVINTGTPGWTMRQQGTWFERHGLAYDPDVVLVAFFPSNALIDLDPVLVSHVVDGHVVPRDIPRDSWLKRLRNRSHLYTWFRRLPDRIRLLLAGRTAEEDWYDIVIRDRLATCARPSDEAALDPAWRNVRDRLAHLRDLVAPRPVVVLVIPDEFQVEPELARRAMARFDLDAASYDLELPQRLIAGICRELGIEVVDVLPELRARTAAGTALYIPLDSHWNEAGNRIAAEALAAAPALAALTRSGTSR